MNKKFFGLLLAAPMMLGFGLTSCSNEDPIADQVSVRKNAVEVTMSASIENLTRTTLDVSETGLKFGWEIGDAVEVVNKANAEHLGTLYVTKLLNNDPHLCEFKGSIYVPETEGKIFLDFYYMGKGASMQEDNNFIAQDHNVDFSTQNGKADNLAANDILSGTSKEGGYTLEEVRGGNLGRINFSRHFAYGYFVMKYNDQVVNVAGKDVTISAASGTLNNRSTLSFADASFTDEAGNIVVTPETDQFYVQFVPSASVRMKFSVDMGDGIMEGTIGSTIASDTYYNDGNGGPIVIAMKYADGRDDKVNYELTFEDEEGGIINNETAFLADEEHTFKISDIDVTAPDKPGYTFKGWALKGTTDVVTTVTLQKQDPTASVYPVYEAIPVYTAMLHLYANFDGAKPEEIIIEKPFTAGGKAVFDISSKDYDSYVGTNGYKLPSRPGYTFLGWSENADADHAEGIDTVTIDTPSYPNQYYYAIWKKDDPRGVIVAPKAEGKDY